MSFFKALGQALDQNIAVSENSDRSLDILKDGHVQQYGALGDFAKEFDHNAKLDYNEQGYVRIGSDQIKPNNTEIYFQQPTYTVLVKKKMFSSLSENFTTNYADKDERLFIRATKILFANKCKQIAAYEKLCIIQNFVSKSNTVQSQVVPIIHSLINSLTTSNAEGDLKAVMDRVKKIYSLNKTENQTEWLTDSTNIFNSIFGEGTGVIELSSLTNISTNVSLEGEGRASFTVQDPYELMIINERDINKALFDASNLVKSNKYVSMGIETLDDIIANKIGRLNALRANRGVGEIIIKINPETLYGKRVTALLGSGTEICFQYNAVSGIGSLFGSGNAGTVVPEEYILDSDKNAYGKEALDRNELSLFKDLIESVYKKVAISINLDGAATTNNESQNYARRKLSMYFLGKTIIQSTDPVFIYINSKTVEDKNILAGIKSSFSERVTFKENLQHSLGDFKTSWNSIFKPKKDVSLQVEKAVFVGPEFPDSLWGSLKSLFTNEVEGTCVFGGIINSARTQWSGGTFTVSVDCNSNKDYLSKGVVNFNPSVDTYNGAMYDPLTPFKTNFDTVTYNSDQAVPELLDENQEILKDLAPKAGSRINKNIKTVEAIHDCSVDEQANKITHKIYAPDGFVYKWKQGIGVFVYDGSAFSKDNIDYVGNPNIYEDAFAGQDVINIFSLLITGQPYNYNTYFRATHDTGKKNTKPKTYLESLKGELNKRNQLWGNFIPFKNFTQSPRDYQRILSNQVSISDLDIKLNQVIQETNSLYNKALESDAITYGSQQTNELLTGAQTKNKEIVDTIAKSYDEKAANLQIIGSDIQFDASSKISDNLASFESRKKVNYLTRRMSWAVKSNEDRNLFIVDDSYDSDQDLIAFGTAIKGGLSSLDNSYLSINEKLNTVSNMFGGIEFFCDTQGHLRVRSPQYNKMPSSVFLRLLEQNKDNVDFFPKFISDLYKNQANDLKRSIEVAEDYIRLYSYSLNKLTDADIENFIKGNTKVIFKFISNSESGTFSQISENIEEDKSFLRVKRQSSLNRVFSSLEKTQAFLSLIPNATTTPESQFTSFQDLSKNIAARIFAKSGQKVDTNELFGKQKVPNYLLILDKISENITKRQDLLKRYEKSLVNASEAKYANNNSEELLFPSFSDNSIPDVFASFIEDENFDDYGPDSGNRYIIKNSNIIRYDISERQPPFTCTQVNGQIDLTLANGPDNLPGPAALNGQAPNGLTSASAIDYDMYRMYGALQSHTVNIAMFNDKDSQCAPYAYALLAKARKDIFSGSIDVPINEYYQLGDVVYLESRNMLFYVTSVRHDITYGSPAKTTLELKYGHTPGEIIPNMLDITGKLLYNNRDKNTWAVDRESDVKGIYLGTFFTDEKKFNDVLNSDSSEQLFNKSTLGTQNQKTYQTVIFSALYKIQHNLKKYKLELRSYKYDVSYNTDFINKVKENLNDVFVGKKPAPKINIGQNTSDDDIILPDFIENVEVDFSDVNENRKPSQAAFDFVRSIGDISTANTSIRETNTSQLLRVIQSRVIDCYLVEAS
jgi:hypothetical protein